MSESPPVLVLARVLVLGLGASGAAAARALAARGAHVVGYDRDPRRAQAVPELASAVSGPEPPSFDAFDRVIVSPGFPIPPHPKLVPEIDVAAELAREVGPYTLVGITGTNGKSTTTELVGAMLTASGVATRVGGNLGTPLCELVGPGADVLVAELSSFQLEHTRAFRADVAVLLNLAPDHLDRHGSPEAYGDAKARLSELQRPGATLVANADDPWTRAVAERATSDVVWFSTGPLAAGAHGAEIDGKDLRVTDGSAERLRIALDRLSDACRRPVDNALAAAAAALAAGAGPEGVCSALEQFEGLPHRGRLVCVRDGVHFIDDSKATNPAAAARSLAALDRPAVWLLGGRGKELPLEPLREAARDARAVVVFGECADELEAALRPAARAATLASAVSTAAALARPGDAVLLAPACASFDEFASFEARGLAFAEAARALPGDSTC